MQVFTRARLKLTGWYLLIITLISVLFSTIMYRDQVAEIERFAARERIRIQATYDFGPNIVFIDNQFIEEAKKRFITRLTVFNLLVLIASGGLGYFLAGRTLSPIEGMVREQRRFISDAAHELRTPLTAMKASLEVYLRDPSASHAEAVGVIRDNAKDVDRLQSLADSLLTLSQLSEQDGSPNFAPVSLADVADASLAHIAPLAKKSKVKLVTHISGVMVSGYFHHLQELMTILLDNAIKYSAVSHGEIDFSVRKAGTQVKLTVKDNGIGIKPEDIPHIFDRFYRSDTARSHNGNGGYGLGLSIAKKIVVEHKGSITVKSSPGNGSTFTVTLPVISA